MSSATYSAKNVLSVSSAIQHSCQGPKSYALCREQMFCIHSTDLQAKTYHPLLDLNPRPRGFLGFFTREFADDVEEAAGGIESR